MAKKEFAYRGKTLEELQKMDDKDFAKLIPSRQRRSILRKYDEEHQRFFKKVKAGKDRIKTHVRDIIITPIMVNKTILVHSGKEYVQVMILPEMLGHRLGEFALSKKRVAHSAPGVGATKSSSSVSVR